MTETLPGLAEVALQPLILASGSPRRRHWLEAMRIPFELQIPDVDETPLLDEDPSDLVLRLAELKAEVIARRNPGRWVMAADTTVAVDHHTLNKPVDLEDAVRMLSLIQGRAHQVHTGFCLQKNDTTHSFVDTAQVFFRPMSEAQMRWYINTREPMDKAGAYAIQGIGALFIENVEGSFSTVMGLPVERMGALFRNLGLLKPWMGFPV
ncbi:nucleoside triphosphate pyrophosphatase [Geothrix sp. PMB-07]|uniref:Maf family protein n=1 Tax=Geothrix sp. PMB-07 TaxID=3068640 RepID=UPI0027413CFF|nr:Maf family protein [Geothrix sp. PMB-07]WLT31286.1 Maf family protein [Geothrix sp. PMB-07]